MSSKFYLAHNAGNREIAGQSFEVVEIVAGTAIGVFKADDAELQAKLDAAVKNPKMAVESIPEKDYDAALKKKAPNFSTFKHTNQPGLQTSMKGVAAVVVENPVPSEDPNAKRLDTVEAALKNTAPIAPPPEADAENTPPAPPATEP